MKKNKDHYYIDYYSAAHWLRPSLILFNDIYQIDPDFMPEDLKEDEDGNPTEIYQYFLTSLTCDDVNYMRKTFPDLIFGYSEKLDLWILCVDHFGTMWKGVWTTCKLPIDVLPDKWDEKGHAKSIRKDEFDILFSKRTF